MRSGQFPVKHHGYTELMGDFGDTSLHFRLTDWYFHAFKEATVLFWRENGIEGNHNGPFARKETE